RRDRWTARPRRYSETCPANCIRLGCPQDQSAQGPRIFRVPVYRPHRPDRTFCVHAKSMELLSPTDPPTSPVVERPRAAASAVATTKLPPFVGSAVGSDAAAANCTAEVVFCVATAS